ncbi:HAD family hydrolase [Actinoplanes sp. CA-131856]
MSSSCRSIVINKCRDGAVLHCSPDQGEDGQHQEGTALLTATTRDQSRSRPAQPTRSRPPRWALITDLDNTLYDFPTFYEAGLRAAVSEITELLSLTPDEAISRLRDVYAERGTIEYAFAVEEFPEMKKVPRETQIAIAKQITNSFWVSATKTLEPYDTVKETLRVLADQRIAVIGYTDAPIHEAMRRLKAMRLDVYLTGIVAQYWRRRRPGYALLMSELPGHARASSRRRFAWRTSQNEKKPNSQVYARIADHLGCEADRVTVIGDSVERDLLPAVQLGFGAVWARYGRRDRAEDHLMMRRIVPDVLPEVRRKGPALPSQISAADRFEDILSYLPVQQMLPIGRRSGE